LASVSLRTSSTHYDALIGSDLIDNAEQEPIGKCMLGMTTGRSCAAVLIGVVLLMAACTNVPPEATAVADQFVRAYFVVDNVAAAAKLTSGAAKSRLDGVLRQIEATGLKEPAKDKPRVKVTPVETQSVSADVIGYVYRIDSETPGIQPITAKLRLSKNGNTWSVSEFVQSP
jgi:hypothetical protein